MVEVKWCRRLSDSTSPIRQPQFAPANTWSSCVAPSSSQPCRATLFAPFSSYIEPWANPIKFSSLTFYTTLSIKHLLQLTSQTKPSQPQLGSSHDTHSSRYQGCEKPPRSINAHDEFISQSYSRTWNQCTWSPTIHRNRYKFTESRNLASTSPDANSRPEDPGIECDLCKRRSSYHGTVACPWVRMIFHCLKVTEHWWMGNRSVKSASNIQLSNDVQVDGKIVSSDYVQLSNKVTVHDKVESSSNIILFDGVKAVGKLQASGSIELRNGVSIDDKVKGMFNSWQLQHNLKSGLTLYSQWLCDHIRRRAGRQNCWKGLRQWISGDFRQCADSGRYLHQWACQDLTFWDWRCLSWRQDQIKWWCHCWRRIDCRVSYAQTKLSRPRKIWMIRNWFWGRDHLVLSGGLTIDGRLHCKGDLEVNGNVYMTPGSQLTVSGKRTIHGSMKELKHWTDEDSKPQVDGTQMAFSYPTFFLSEEKDDSIRICFNNRLYTWRKAKFDYLSGASIRS